MQRLSVLIRKDRQQKMKIIHVDAEIVLITYLTDGI